MVPDRVASAGPPSFFQSIVVGVTRSCSTLPQIIKSQSAIMSTATLPPSSGPSPQEMKLARRQSRKSGLFDPQLMKTAFWQSLVMLRPDIQWTNPVMFVVEVGTVLTLVYTVAKLCGCKARHRWATLWRWISGWWRRSCSRTSPRPSPRPAARPRPTPCGRPAGPPRPGDAGRRRIEETVSTALKSGDKVEVVGGRSDPQRRRDHRRRGFYRRIGHNRRVGPRDPRGRRRPLRRDGRHAGPFRPHRRAKSPPARANRSSTA